MKKLNRIIALLSAMTMLGTLNVAAVPSFVSAEEAVTAVQTDVTALPEWVPQNYTEAIDFYNKHGKTYIADGFICTVHSRDTWGERSFKTEDAGSTINYEDDIVYTNLFDKFVWPDEPVESDYETMEEYNVAYMEYRTELNKVGLSPSDRKYYEERGYFTNPEHAYAVTVYRPDEAGKMSFSWIERNSNNNVVSQTDLSFEIAENGTITQTDYYGWLPDCIEEYNTFFEENGTVSVHNNHVVYCKDICYDGGLDVEFSQNGTGEIEEEISYSACRQVFLTPPGGMGGQTVKVYNPTVSGTVIGTWLYSQLWDPDCEFAEEDSATFNISEDLTVTKADCSAPEWVPQTYNEAMDFYNKYGQTYCENDYICTVQQKWDWENYLYETKYSGTAECDVLFNQEYTLDNGGYIYEVTLYSAESSGNAEISWSYTDTRYEKVTEVADFSFDIADNFTVTQTDLYSWVPDSIEEYEKFRQNYGIASVYNGYVVYCNDIMESAGFSLIADQAGTGKLETVLDSYVREAVDIEVVGGASHRIIVYKPVTAGDVTMTWTHGRLWELDAEYTDITVQYYTVTEGLSINAEYNNGDCNLDGKAFVIADIVALKKYLTRASENYDIFSPQNADVNNDGKINVFDFIIMKRDFSHPTGLPNVENHLEYTVLEDECIRANITEMTFSAFIANSAEELYNIVENNEKLTHEEIDESIFDSKAAVIVYTQSGAGNRTITVDDVFVENHRDLVIETTTVHPDYATPDMAYNRIILLVDKNAVADVTGTAVRNNNISES